MEPPTEGAIWLVGTAFTALFGFLSIVATGLFKLRTEAREARNEAKKAAEIVSSVETNTQGFGGFPDRMDRKLDGLAQSTARMESRLTRLENRMTGHLEWHMKEGRKR